MVRRDCMMQKRFHITLSSNGQDQVLTIPSELALSSPDVWLHKEGQRLIIELMSPPSLLSSLTTLPNIEDPFPDVDEGLVPLDDITL